MSMSQLGVHNKDGSLRQPPEYKDGRTKQAFADETNIKLIMARAEKAGTISHLQKFEGTYADFSDFDFFEQTRMLTRGREIFDELPAEIRKEFGQSPAQFFKYVNDPENAESLRAKLPALAQPGRQLLSAKPETADEDTKEKIKADEVSEKPADKAETIPTSTPEPTPATSKAE